MKFLDQKYFHFIGIGGIGTSSLAQILNKKGKIVSGSDCCDSEITENLKKSGIKISTKHDSKNIHKKHQLIIYSPAIPAKNIELKKAKELKIACISYPEALGELTKNHDTIAISGTHGKSTTTAISSLIACNGKLDPTVVVGTKIKEFEYKNYRAGNSKNLIIEACEYKRSFLNFFPKILIITNIEADHLDYYKNLKDYKKAFKELIKNIPENGRIIINSDDRNSLDVIKNAKSEIIILEISKIADKFKKSQKIIIFKLKKNTLLTPDNKKIKIHPGIPGKFNIKNAANAAIIGHILKVPIKIIEKTIKNYQGSWRRLEYKKTRLKNTKFIDDYGHHPTEIRLTLNAIREKNPTSKILCIFQPHQYSRTRLLLKDFGKSFNSADEIIIPDIYRSRDSEEDLKNVSVDKLVAEINKHDTNAKNGQGIEKTAEYIKKHYPKFDIIVTMGAGDISRIYKLL